MNDLAKKDLLVFLYGMYISHLKSNNSIPQRCDYIEILAYAHSKSWSIHFLEKLLENLESESYITITNDITQDPILTNLGLNYAKKLMS